MWWDWMSSKFIRFEEAHFDLWSWATMAVAAGVLVFEDKDSSCLHAVMNKSIYTSLLPKLHEFRVPDWIYCKKPTLLPPDQMVFPSTYSSP